MKAVLITMMGSKITMGGNTYEKGFTLLLPADDPNVPLFRQKPCFKFEDRFMSDRPTEAAIPEGHTLISEVKGVSKKVAAALTKAGFTTAEMVLSDTVSREELLKVKGVGENSVDKVIDACETAVPEEGDEE